MNFLKKLFKTKKDNNSDKINAQNITDNDFAQEEYDLDYELKDKGLEHVLGKAYHMVGHAIIPFNIGGAVDMYYFTEHIPGTGFATMELLDPHGKGPKPNRLGTYELVAFTKEPYNTSDKKNAFNTIERRMCGNLTRMGYYGKDAALNPGDTCELPIDDAEIRYVIFDNYAPDNKKFTIGNRDHHLLLCMEIFKDELDYSRAKGSSELFTLLKQKGVYPYSDLGRESVLKNISGD